MRRRARAATCGGNCTSTRQGRGMLLLLLLLLLCCAAAAAVLCCAMLCRAVLWVQLVPAVPRVGGAVLLPFCSPAEVMCAISAAFALGTCLRCAGGGQLPFCTGAQLPAGLNAHSRPVSGLGEPTCCWSRLFRLSRTAALGWMVWVEQTHMQHTRKQQPTGRV